MNPNGSCTKDRERRDLVKCWCLFDHKLLKCVFSRYTCDVKVLRHFPIFSLQWLCAIWILFTYALLFTYVYFFILFSVRLLSVLRGHSVFSSPSQRPMTSDFEGFLYQILSITLFSYLNSWERVSIFPFQCWMLNKGTTDTICLTSLLSRGPWLGIEHGTSRTRSQHSTTRLSMRRSLTGGWTRDLPHSKPALFH